jgi:hypothetical protein
MKKVATPLEAEFWAVLNFSESGLIEEISQALQARLRHVRVGKCGRFTNLRIGLSYPRARRFLRWLEKTLRH